MSAFEAFAKELSYPILTEIGLHRSEQNVRRVFQAIDICANWRLAHIVTWGNDHVFQVYSQGHGDTQYQTVVNLSNGSCVCDCPDHVKRNGEKQANNVGANSHWCKHAIACYLALNCLHCDTRLSLAIQKSAGVASLHGAALWWHVNQPVPYKGVRTDDNYLA